MILAISAVANWHELAHRNIVESVKVTAHRGSSARAPENTLSAVRQAITDGADFAEIDVQTTADGELVVLHDGDLMRMAGDSRRLRDLTLSQAKELDVGKKFNAEFEGERIPTLAEVIRLSRGRIQLNIELKYNWPDPSLAGKVVELLRREGFPDQLHYHFSGSGRAGGSSAIGTRAEGRSDRDGVGGERDSSAGSDSEREPARSNPTVHSTGAHCGQGGACLDVEPSGRHASDDREGREQPDHGPSRCCR